MLFGGCSFPCKVVAALEINTTSNFVYRQNFGSTVLLQKNIEGLTVRDIDNLSADVFVMSPPCQPFTRLGLQAASKDPRTKSFLHILDLLPKLSKPPDYILMENVKGFETSDTREHFLETLKSCGYSYQEFLLSPTQFGIPNSRLRYYLLAKRKPRQFCFAVQDEIMERIPQYSRTKLTQLSLSQTTHKICCQNCVLTPRGNEDENEITDNGQPLSTAATKCYSADKLELENFACKGCQQLRTMKISTSGDILNETSSGNCEVFSNGRISDYLEKDKPDEYFEDFLLSEKVLSKFALLLDIVTVHSERSCCFTKAYGHYAEGTGSVLKMADIDDTEIFCKYRDLSNEKQKSQLLSVLRLRYFTPREVANLHGFPTEFCFPASVSVKQKYRLLGNSLNVHVVSELMNCLLQSPS